MRVLEYAAEALKNDCEFATEAVKQRGVALEYAADALKGDLELKAVNQFGGALHYAAIA